jgi:integrase
VRINFGASGSTSEQLTPRSPKWLTDWLQSNPAKRPGTVARDASVVNFHLIPTFGHFAVGRISPGDIQRSVSTWSARYRPASVRRHYAVLRAIFSHAVAIDMIARSPCRAIKLPTIEHDDRLLPDAEGLARIAVAIGLDLAPMVYIAGVLGLRWGECAGRRVGRVDFLHSTVAGPSRSLEVEADPL